MNRYYIFKDDTQIGSTATKGEMESLIHAEKAEDNKKSCAWLKSEYSYIYGEEVFLK